MIGGLASRPVIICQYFQLLALVGFEDHVRHLGMLYGRSAWTPVRQMPRRTEAKEKDVFILNMVVCVIG